MLTFFDQAKRAKQPVRDSPNQERERIRHIKDEVNTVRLGIYFSLVSLATGTRDYRIEILFLSRRRLHGRGRYKHETSA